MDGRRQHSHWAWSLLAMAVVAGCAIEASVSIMPLSSHYCPPCYPLNMILSSYSSGLTLEGCVVSDMPRGTDVCFDSRNLFRVLVRPALTWDSGHL